MKFNGVRLQGASEVSVARAVMHVQGTSRWGIALVALSVVPIMLARVMNSEPLSDLLSIFGATGLISAAVLTLAANSLRRWTVGVAVLSLIAVIFGFLSDSAASAALLCTLGGIGMVCTVCLGMKVLS